MTLSPRSRMSLRHFALHGVLWAMVVSLSRPALAQDVASGTTIYGTGESGTNWTGGTISPGATLRLNDGASVFGSAITNGTLQFNQSAGSTLTISNVISGTGTLSLTNTGTLNLTGTTVANTVVLDMTTSASSGLLQIRSRNSNPLGRRRQGHAERDWRPCQQQGWHSRQ